MNTIAGDNLECGERPPQPARVPFRVIMECLSNNDVAHAHEICVNFKCRPKLGQLLVHSGRLSPDDLSDLLIVHEHEELKNVPMGKLLVIAGCLTANELRSYLTLQKMLRLPSDHHERWGQKLVDQGYITQEQLNIALNDRMLRKTSLRDCILARGWATPGELPEFTES